MSKLTDLEICKRIAEIEGVDFRIQNGKVLPENPAEAITGKLTDVYNPLTDDALCFKLMIKYNVSFWQNDGIFIFCAKVRNADFRVVRVKLPNLAICLAIIESKVKV
jgi:hypothetical protein